MADWRLRWGFPFLSKLPGSLPWLLAPYLGRDSLKVRHETEKFLIGVFQRAFPEASANKFPVWAKKHMEMIALELVDSLNYDRFGNGYGLEINLQGWPVVESLRSQNKGFILVLNHYDRLILAAIALARKGVSLNIVTMPVFDNPGLSDDQKKFLVNKISKIIEITGGEWRISSESLRPVYQSLRSGGVWVILADAWSPDFLRMRKHRFLGGYLNLPTGIERIAGATGADLVQGFVYTKKKNKVDVLIKSLPSNPESALNQVIQNLESDVKMHPWGWWHWGMWEQMWQPEFLKDTE